MPSVLKNVLRFTDLAVGVPAQQAHGLNYNGSPKAPHFCWAGSGGFVIAADSTNVTVTRSGDATQVDVAVELWHSLENAQPSPNGIAPALLPFIAQGVTAVTPSVDALSISLPNGDSSIILHGAPVVISGGALLLGDASSPTAAPIIGLARIGALQGMTVVAQVLGLLMLPADGWDLITGQVGGLTPNQIYYLSTVAGQISLTAPVTPGEYVVEVGRAITSEIMLIQASQPILL